MPRHVRGRSDTAGQCRRRRIGSCVSDIGRMRGLYESDMAWPITKVASGRPWGVIVLLSLGGSLIVIGKLSGNRRNRPGPDFPECPTFPMAATSQPNTDKALR